MTRILVPLLAVTLAAAPAVGQGLTNPPMPGLNNGPPGFVPRPGVPTVFPRHFPLVGVPPRVPRGEVTKGFDAHPVRADRRRHMPAAAVAGPARGRVPPRQPRPHRGRHPPPGPDRLPAQPVGRAGAGAPPRPPADG